MKTGASLIHPKYVILSKAKDLPESQQTRHLAFQTPRSIFSESSGLFAAFDFAKLHAQSDILP